MEESRFNAEFANINVRMDVIDDRLECLENQLGEIETKLQNIFWFIEFHLGKVPQKYKKFLPKKDEYPYFGETGNFCKDKNIPEFNQLSELDIPKDPEMLKATKERMMGLGEKGWPKRASSAACPTSSVSPDSCQADKPSESSPSLQEEPDHKNPPSQT